MYHNYFNLSTSKSYHLTTSTELKRKVLLASRRCLLFLGTCSHFLLGVHFCSKRRRNMLNFHFGFPDFVCPCFHDSILINGFSPTTFHSNSFCYKIIFIILHWFLLWPKGQFKPQHHSFSFMDSNFSSPPTIYLFFSQSVCYAGARSY